MTKLWTIFTVLAALFILCGLKLTPVNAQGGNPIVDQDWDPNSGQIVNTYANGDKFVWTGCSDATGTCTGGYALNCGPSGCSGSDTGDPAPWCVSPSSYGCSWCDGGCVTVVQCSESDCGGPGVSYNGCDCHYICYGGGEGCDFTGVSGSYCGSRCSDRNETECKNTSVCSWVDRSGQCSGTCSGGRCGGYCGGTQICCTPPAPLPPPPKTCFINSVSPSTTVTSGDSVTVNFSGNNFANTDPSDVARLWLQHWPSATSIVPEPSPIVDIFNNSGQTSYELASCVSEGAAICSGSYTLPNLPTGTYYVHCDFPTQPNICSGNPYCSYENLGGTNDCTGWRSCSNNDNKLITVLAPPATIQSRAVVVGATATCDEIRASTNGINGTVHAFTVAPSPTPAPQTQSGANYVTFSSTYAGTYTLSPTVPSDYVLRRACWQSTNPAGSGEGLSVNAVADGTLTWDVGYSAGSGWAQTKEGNVYAGGTIKNLVPSLASPRVFNLDSASLYPGIVTYGTDYDFDSAGGKGANLVSSKNWLANQTNTTVDYYQLFYRRVGSPTTPDIFADLTAVTKPASRPTPYYVVGDMTTNGDWVVGNGESIVFLIDGNLTMGGNVNITGTGFVAFIVKGNITVSPGVGRLYSSSAPDIEGIYVAGGTFLTGTASVLNKERFVGKGMFVANSFALERDLDSLGRNITTSAELFTYNPQLLFTMPDYMKDVPVTWQEVAP